MTLYSTARQLVRRFISTAVPAFPSGHFYSPIADPAEIRRDSYRIFDRSQRITDVDLREDAQVSLVREIAEHYSSLPFVPSRGAGQRFYYENPMFGYSDAVIYACLLAHRRPKRVVEVGSGFSSALLLDMRDTGLCGNPDCHFIDPNPERLHRLLSTEDRATATIHCARVQDLQLGIFEALEPGDMLFIDSSHVAKIGSDVCHEMFTILPRLAPGVAIHFHDIFYPFEYPEDWFFQLKRSWNEAYLVRALLADSRRYRILLFGDFLHRFHQRLMAQCLPNSVKGTGGSLWIETAPNL